MNKANSISSKLIIYICVMFLLSSCRGDVVDKPIGNPFKGDFHHLDGKWSAIDSSTNGLVDLSITHIEKSRFSLTLSQGGKKIAFDTILTQCNDRKMFNASAYSAYNEGKLIYSDYGRYYSLIDVALTGDALVLTKADMETFREIFKSNLQVSKKIILPKCLGDSDLAKMCNSNSQDEKILQIKNTKKLQADLIKNYDAIFKKSESMTFTRGGMGQIELLPAGS